MLILIYVLHKLASVFDSGVWTLQFYFFLNSTRQRKMSAHTHTQNPLLRSTRKESAHGQRNDETHVQVHMSIFVTSIHWAPPPPTPPPSVFSPYWGKNILVGPKRKHPGPPPFISLPLPTKDSDSLGFIGYSTK